MEIDFKCRADMYGYTERRLVIDVNKYARYFLSMGNVFRECSPGIYDACTGDQLVDYVIGARYRSPDSAVKWNYIHCWEDFEAATDDVYSRDRVTVSKRNLKRVQVTEKPPIHKLAKEAAAQVYSRLLYENYKHVIFGQNVPRDLSDIVYYDDIEENKTNWNLLRRLEEDIVRDMDHDLRDIGWKELLFQKRNGVYMVDVMLDIRLKDFYERKFEREEQEADMRRENEYEGRSIQCT